MRQKFASVSEDFASQARQPLETQFGSGVTLAASFLFETTLAVGSLGRSDAGRVAGPRMPKAPVVGPQCPGRPLAGAATPCGEFVG